VAYQNIVALHPICATIFGMAETEPIVRSIDAALNWFLESHDVTILCVADNGQEMRCSDFDQARQFFILNNTRDE
jgi:hypothetical protein